MEVKDQLGQAFVGHIEWAVLSFDTNDLSSCNQRKYNYKGHQSGAHEHQVAPKNLMSIPRPIVKKINNNVTSNGIDIVISEYCSRNNHVKT